MIPWVHLDSALAPGGDHDLRLLRRGAEFSIRLGHNELMNSRLSGSEKALATLTAEKLAGRTAPRTLIGGLGMGFTLGAALGSLPPDAKVVVAELVPAVVAWARGPMETLTAGCLDDPRVRLVVGDVRAEIGGAPKRFDAILLDVDNGPEGLSRSANDALYDLPGLGAAHAALRPFGVLAVWSQGPDAHFSRRLRQARFAADEIPVRAAGKRGGSRHLIPAPISPKIYDRVQKLSLKAHAALGCRGVTRTDFRYNDAAGEDGELVCLEINTQPGMTPTSLAPEQALHAGHSFEELVSWMVEDASCDR